MRLFNKKNDIRKINEESLLFYDLVKKKTAKFMNQNCSFEELECQKLLKYI